MNEVEVLKILTGAVTAEYDHTDSYPVTGLTGIGLDIINTDSSNALTVTLTQDNGTLTITIPPSSEFKNYTKPFKTLTKGGSATSFYIRVISER